jgi:hypothetical protein
MTIIGMIFFMSFSILIFISIARKENWTLETNLTPIGAQNRQQKLTCSTQDCVVPTLKDSINAIFQNSVFIVNLPLGMGSSCEGLSYWVSYYNKDQHEFFGVHTGRSWTK